MEINSSLLPNSAAIEIDKFENSKIIRLYKELYNIDVSSYFKEKETKLYKCVKSGFRFFYPFTIVGDGAFYANLYKDDTGTFYPKKRWEFVKALSFINNKENILDVGCGTGAFIKYAKEEKQVTPNGLEINKDAILKLRNEGYNIIEDWITQASLKFKSSFDVVTAFQVLEHVSNPSDFLDACFNLAKPNGKIIIGVPNSNPYLYKTDKFHTLNLPPHHMGLWDKDSFIKYAENKKRKIQYLGIEPMDNVFYYLCCKAGIQHTILKISKNYIARKFFAAVRVLLSPFKGLTEGRGLLVVFQKNED